MHDRGRLLLRDVRFEPDLQLSDPRHLATQRRVELQAPATYLPFEEVVGTPEVGEPDRRWRHVVQRRQRLDHSPRDDLGPPGAQGAQLRGVPVRSPFDPLHHVEGSTEDLDVVTHEVRRWNRDTAPVESRDHPVFTGHVVGGREYMAERRSSHHPAEPPVGDLVGQVGLAPGQQPGRERTRHLSWPETVEVRAEAVEVQARQCPLAEPCRRANHASPADVVTRSRSPAAWSLRSSTLSVFPTVVRGIASVTAQRSGTHQRATRSLRKPHSSSRLTSVSSDRTMKARGRSWNRASSTPMTAASATAGCSRRAFSSSRDEIHSPPDLMMSFSRSVIRRTRDGRWSRHHRF